MADQALGAVETADVVIVGAGPTGLMLAIELCLAGVRPVVLERLTAISEIPKGNGLVGHIVPALDHRDLLDRLRAGATYAGPVPSFSFGPLRLELSRLGVSPLHVLAIPQRAAQFVLLDVTSDGRVSVAAADWGERVPVVRAEPLAEPAPADALLIRPDGYVAWASGPRDTDPAEGLRDALTAWCGAAG